MIKKKTIGQPERQNEIFKHVNARESFLKKYVFCVLTDGSGLSRGRGGLESQLSLIPLLECLHNGNGNGQLTVGKHA